MAEPGRPKMMDHNKERKKIGLLTSTITTQPVVVTAQ